MVNQKNTGANLNKFAYAYDTRDVRTSVQQTYGSDPLRQVGYTYDSVDQLKSESATGGAANTNYSNAFDYDGMGNRTRAENVSGGNTSVTQTTPNELNQISALSSSLNGAPAQTSGFGYDAAGNTTVIKSTDGTRTVFSYDDADRLTRIGQQTLGEVPLSKSEFIYDYASRKAVSREFTYTAGAWVKTDEKRRVFDGLDVIQERNAQNEVTAQLVRDGNIGGILARSTAAGASFFGYDGGGNVTLLTDENGDDVGRYRYDAFGNTLEVSGSRAAENPYRFSTKELHAASGLYDFGLRFYSPGLGRWINQDPISEAGGLNLYAMVGNDPINAVDVYGLRPAQAPGIIDVFRATGSRIVAGASSAGRAIATGAASAGRAAVSGAKTVTGASAAGSMGLMLGVIVATAKPVGDGTLAGNPKYVAAMAVQAANKKKKKTSKSSKKARSTNFPSWFPAASQIVKREKDESCQDYITRVLNKKYGEGKWGKGSESESEYSALFKACERGNNPNFREQVGFGPPNIDPVPTRTPIR